MLIQLREFVAWGLVRVLSDSLRYCGRAETLHHVETCVNSRMVVRNTFGQRVLGPA